MSMKCWCWYIKCLKKKWSVVTNERIFPRKRVEDNLVEFHSNEKQWVEPPITHSFGTPNLKKFYRKNISFWSEIWLQVYFLCLQNFWYKHSQGRYSPNNDYLRVSCICNSSICPSKFHGLSWKLFIIVDQKYTSTICNFFIHHRMRSFFKQFNYRIIPLESK